MQRSSHGGRGVHGVIEEGHRVDLIVENNVELKSVETLLSVLAPVTVEKIIAGYQQLIDRAHLQGIKVIGATLTPFEDSFAGAPLQTFYSPEKEKMRQAVNEWIRQSGAYGGVIDFDAVVRDPQRPRGFAQSTTAATI